MTAAKHGPEDLRGCFRPTNFYYRASASSGGLKVEVDAGTSLRKPA
jgi:hypothetical protein